MQLVSQMTWIPEVRMKPLVFSEVAHHLGILTQL